MKYEEETLTLHHRCQYHTEQGIFTRNVQSWIYKCGIALVDLGELKLVLVRVTLVVDMVSFSVHTDRVTTDCNLGQYDISCYVKIQKGL